MRKFLFILFAFGCTRSVEVVYEPGASTANGADSTHPAFVSEPLELAKPVPKGDILDLRVAETARHRLHWINGTGRDYIVVENHAGTRIQDRYAFGWSGDNARILPLNGSDAHDSWFVHPHRASVRILHVTDDDGIESAYVRNTPNRSRDNRVPTGGALSFDGRRLLSVALNHEGNLAFEFNSVEALRASFEGYQSRGSGVAPEAILTPLIAPPPSDSLYPIRVAECAPIGVSEDIACLFVRRESFYCNWSRGSRETLELAQLAQVADGYEIVQTTSLDEGPCDGFQAIDLVANDAHSLLFTLQSESSELLFGDVVVQARQLKATQYRRTGDAKSTLRAGNDGASHAFFVESPTRIIEQTYIDGHWPIAVHTTEHQVDSAFEVSASGSRPVFFTNSKHRVIAFGADSELGGSQVFTAFTAPPDHVCIRKAPSGRVMAAAAFPGIGGAGVLQQNIEATLAGSTVRSEVSFGTLNSPYSNGCDDGLGQFIEYDANTINVSGSTPWTAPLQRADGEFAIRGIFQADQVQTVSLTESAGRVSVMSSLTKSSQSDAPIVTPLAWRRPQPIASNEEFGRWFLHALEPKDGTQWMWARASTRSRNEDEPTLVFSIGEEGNAANATLIDVSGALTIPLRQTDANLHVREHWVMDVTDHDVLLAFYASTDQDFLYHRKYVYGFAIIARDSSVRALRHSAPRVGDKFESGNLRAGVMRDGSAALVFASTNTSDLDNHHALVVLHAPRDLENLNEIIVTEGNIASDHEIAGTTEGAFVGYFDWTKDTHFGLHVPLQLSEPAL